VVDRGAIEPTLDQPKQTEEPDMILTPKQTIREHGEPASTRLSMCKDQHCVEPMGLGKTTHDFVDLKGFTLSAGETFSILSKGNDGFWDGKFSDGQRRLYPSKLVHEIAIFDKSPRFSIAGSLGVDGQAEYGDVVSERSQESSEVDATHRIDDSLITADTDPVPGTPHDGVPETAHIQAATRTHEGESLTADSARDAMAAAQKAHDDAQNTDRADPQQKHDSTAQEEEPEPAQQSELENANRHSTNSENILTKAQQRTSTDSEPNNDDDENWGNTGQDNVASKEHASPDVRVSNDAATETDSSTSTPTTATGDALADLSLQDVVALAPVTFSSLLGLNLLFFCAFLFGSGGNKKLEKKYSDTLNAKTTLELQLEDVQKSLHEMEASHSRGASNDGRRAQQAEAQLQQARSERDLSARELATIQRAATDATAQRDGLQADIHLTQQKHVEELESVRSQLGDAKTAHEAVQKEVNDAKDATKEARGEVTRLAIEATALRNDLTVQRAATEKLEEQLSLRRVNEDVAEKYIT
jgi:hypothetical protein